jgi:hypothetical protein
VCWVIGCAVETESAPPPRTASAPSVEAAATTPEPEASPSEATEADEAVVAGMQQGFRECYQIGLWNNPHQSGSVRLVLKLDPRGRPTTVTPVGGAGLDRMVLDCLVRVARRASFGPSSGGSIVVPLKFRSDRALEPGARPTASRANRH